MIKINPISSFVSSLSIQPRKYSYRKILNSHTQESRLVENKAEENGNRRRKIKFLIKDFYQLCLKVNRFAYKSEIRLKLGTQDINEIAEISSQIGSCIQKLSNKHTEIQNELKAFGAEKIRAYLYFQEGSLLGIPLNRDLAPSEIDECIKGVAFDRICFLEDDIHSMCRENSECKLPHVIKEEIESLIKYFHHLSLQANELYREAQRYIANEKALTESKGFEFKRISKISAIYDKATFFREELSKTSAQIQNNIQGYPFAQIELSYFREGPLLNIPVNTKVALQQISDPIVKTGLEMALFLEKLQKQAKDQETVLRRSVIKIQNPP